ncbi:MAG: hypothetical protein R3Y29_03725 [bacterium]
MQDNNKNKENLIKLKRLEGKRVDFSTKLEELRVEHNKDMVFLHSNYTKQRNEVINKYETKRNTTKNQLDKTEAEIVKLLEILEYENNGVLTNEVLGNLLSVVKTPEFSLEDPDTEEEAMDNLLNEMQGLLEDH